MRVCNYFNNTFTIMYPGAIIIENKLILKLGIEFGDNWSGKQIGLPRTNITVDFPTQRKHMLTIYRSYITFEKWNEHHVQWLVEL